MHASRIMDEIPGLDQHCKTMLPNSICPYLKLGCLGCTHRAPGTFPLGELKNPDWTKTLFVRFELAVQDTTGEMLPGASGETPATEDKLRSLGTHCQLKADEETHQ